MTVIDVLLTVNPTNGFKVKEGPSLNQARAYHCSATMEVNNRKLIAVAGGDGQSYLNSVEILDPASGLGWMRGPKLPFKLSTASMITSPTGRGVVVIGGWNDRSNRYSTTILELHGRTMEWIPLKQTLSYGRVGHLSFYVPDEITSVRKIQTTKPKWKKIRNKIPKLLKNVIL